MFVMSASERPEEDEVSDQVGRELRIQRGRADNPPKNLHDRLGIQSDTGSHRPLHETSGSGTVPNALCGGSLRPLNHALGLK